MTRSNGRWQRCIGRRVLALSGPLVILWVLSTVFITLHLDQTYDRTKRQALPPTLGYHGRHLNPLDVVREKNRLAVTKQDPSLKGRGFATVLDRSARVVRKPRVLKKRITNATFLKLDLNKLPQYQSRGRDWHIDRHHGEPMVMEPKIYDTQGKARACVSRSSDTGICEMHRCGGDGNGTNHDMSRVGEYRFIVHDRNNTRGRLPLFSGGRGCAISHRYKFIYIHVQKSGGMTVKTILKRGLCGGVTQTCDDLEIVDCNSAIYGFPQYFVFTFVRNPFSRIYSAYSMADTMRKRNARSLRFEEFANMTLKERQATSTLTKSHYGLQINFLMDSSNCPVFDFLGRLEYFQDDMQTILNQIRSPDLQTFFSTSGGKDLVDNCTNFGDRKKQSELGGNLRNAYRLQSTVDAIAKEFESDFALLGYDSTQIPSE